MVKHFLSLFERAANRVRPALRPHELEVEAGSWLGSSALKVQMRRWTQPKANPNDPHAGIFFSVWVEPKGLKKRQAFYNIHALRLRSLNAYALQSREFAEAFRARFARQRAGWPNVSVDFGPQTLMQGWIPLDESRLEQDTVALIQRFVPLSALIDELLEQRKSS